jgi:hypothetical protein
VDLHERRFRTRRWPRAEDTRYRWGLHTSVFRHQKQQIHGVAGLLAKRWLTSALISTGERDELSITTLSSSNAGRIQSTKNALLSEVLRVSKFRFVA